MRFQEPLALLFLLLAPLWMLVFSRLERRRTRRVAGAGDPALVEALVLADADGGRRRRLFQALLIAAALTFAALALSRPQLGMRTELRKGRGIDLVVALDLSKSMLARDVVPSRLDRARIEVTELIQRLKGDRIGLVGFTSVALPLCPLTVDHSALLLQLRSSGPDDFPRGGTAIGDAIAAGERMLAASKKTSAERAILVITDGEDNEGDAVTAAKKAKESGITVHVVGVGSKTGEPIPTFDESGKLTGYMKDRAGQTVVSRLNDTLLREIADATGGIATLPSEAGGLDLGPIRTHLATLKKAELEERTVRVYEERYQWLLLPSFLCLLWATLLRPTRRPVRLVVKNLSSLGTAGALVVGLAFASPASASPPLQREDPDAQAGKTALEAGKHAEAVEAYGRAVARLGEDPRLLFDRGLAAAQGGELDRAASDLRAAMEAGKDPALRAQAAFALGNTYRKLKKWNEALEAYRRTLLEDPTHTGARRNLEITSRMKAIEAMQPKNPNSKQNDGDQSPPPEGRDGGPSDGGDTRDGGPSDASMGDGGTDGRDGGTDSEQSGEDSRGDAGPSGGDAASSSSSGADAGGAQDAGQATPEPEPSPEEKQAEATPEQKDLEEMLDALQDQEKALKRQRLLKKMGSKHVEKDW